MNDAAYGEIQVGDRVRIVHAVPYPSGLTGTVFALVDRYLSKFPLQVELDEGAGRIILAATEVEVITEVEDVNEDA